MGYRGKRALDLLVTAPIVVVLAPVCAMIALLVAWKLGRPVIFRQMRPGLNGQPFTMYKFRTMTDDRDEFGNLLSDDARLTGFGRWLRSTSLDELPELLCVLKGEMSLVGPRPLLMHYLDRYTPRQARRNDVKPGVTGWVQVNGRNALSWHDKFEHDVWYVENASLRLDIKILALTAWRVLRREGISAASSATMPEFLGSESTVRADSKAG